MSDTMDYDAEFWKIVDGLEAELDTDPQDVIDYTKLSDMELAAAYHEVRQELHDMGAMHEKNPVGRAAELRSQFSAITEAMRRKWPKFGDKDKKK